LARLALVVLLLVRRSAARRVARLDMWKLLVRNEKARREMKDLGRAF
jgi:hypothetical protein